jgi:diacylglycerol kinase family enzyme
LNDRREPSSILRESAVIVYVNAEAGGGRAHSYLGRMQKLFESFQVDAQFVMTNSAAELESCAQDAISQGPRVLFAMGGDGTFQALANAAFGAETL